jgi:DNA helicase-2/ATP-dependent DNA helicase PcrA
MLDLSRLNENQRRAVNWGAGPLLVLAGPGSGKTLVLTMRVARLIQQNPDARFRVLGLTFTTKAADEMRQRVEHLLGPDARRARLTTFHSFCAEVLRQHGSHLGLRPDFEILTQDADRHRVLDEAIKEADVSDMPPVEGKGVVKMIDHLLGEGFDGEESTTLPFAGTDKEWIRPIFNEYVRVLLRANHLDFGMLLVCCLRLFRDRPRVAMHYRIVFPYICVDEYQDTNKAQDLLLRALCPNDGDNLFVVADDDQIIYQWNGASPERLRKLRLDYGMPVIQLPESYRCPAAVVDLANNLIRHNTERSPDKSVLVAASEANPADALRVHYFSDHNQEMAWVARDIRDRSLDPRNCAILARSAKLLHAAADALRGAGLSPYLAMRKNEFESPALRFVHAALRLANAPQDDEQLQRLCKAFFDLTGEDVRADDADAESAVHGGALLRGFISAAAGAAEGDTSSHPWGPLLHSLEQQLVERLRYREFAKEVFDWCSQRREQMGGDDGFADEIDEVAVWNDIWRSVRQHFGVDPTLSQFLQELDLRQKTSPPKDDEVQCLTIHLAKGKEFQHVYLVGLAEAQLPSYYAKQKGEHSRAIEEERRSCFVAITRVQSQLTLTFATSYFGWPKQPSRFLTEMGIDLRPARG